MNFLKGVLVLACLFFLQACNYKNLKSQDDAPNTQQSVSAADFAFVMQEVLGPKCLQCHSGSSSFGVLETYPQVFAYKNMIKSYVATDFMPFRRAPLTASEKQILNSWIDAGAPEFITASSTPAPPVRVGPPQPEPSPVRSEPGPIPPVEEPSPIEPVEPAKDWLTVKTLVIDPACLRCHSAPRNRGDTNLETYQNTLKKLARVKDEIETDSMPLGGTLTAEQKKLILDWIQDGAPEFAAK